jgi:hypothetical protein
LKFFIDGVEKADDEQQGDSRETQKEIERIIGFPHNMFKHLIALNTYTEPFLSMKTNDQRDMIEQLLGIKDLSLKAEQLKEKTKRSKDDIKEEGPAHGFLNKLSSPGTPPSPESSYSSENGDDNNHNTRMILLDHLQFLQKFNDLKKKRGYYYAI